MTQAAENAQAIAENDKRISVHEAVCAARYVSIDAKLEDGKARFDTLDKHIKWLGAGLLLNTLAILAGPGVAAEFFKKFLGL